MLGSRKYLLSWLLVGLMILLSACNLSSQNETNLVNDDEDKSSVPETELLFEETEESFATVTPENIENGTDLPTPTLASQEIGIAFDFKELAFFGLQPFDYTICEEATYSVNGSGPQMFVDDSFGAILTGRKYLCLLNFNPYQPVEVEITDPNNQLAGLLEIIPEQDIFGSIVGIVPLTFTLDMPLGTWSAIATQDDQQSGLEFDFQSGEYPFLVVSRKLPEENQSPVDPQRTASFRPGETILVQGLNFPPGIDLPVALNAYQENAWNNIDGKVVRVSDAGLIDLEFTLTEDLPSGSYMIFLLIEEFTGFDFQPSVFYVFIIQ